MADTGRDADIRAALQQIKERGPHSPEGAEAWRAIAAIVRRMASQVRYASVPAAVADAEDVAASVMVRLQSEPLRRRIMASRSPAAYLRGMARYVLIDHLRAIETSTVPLEANLPAHDADAPEIVGSTDLAVERLRSAVGALSSSEQLLVRQRFWDGMSVADIARGLGEPYSRVAVRLFRVTRKLRRALESR